MYLDPISVILGISGGLIFLALYGLAYIYWRRRRRAAALARVDLDHLDGPAFERYVARLLEQRGYRVQHTGRSGDLGVDLIAEKAPYRYAIQVKRQDDPVSRRAVSDAVAGKQHYGCNAAMVITNNFFSPGAKQLARSTGCRLVDRATLADWILDAAQVSSIERF